MVLGGTGWKVHSGPRWYPGTPEHWLALLGSMTIGQQGNKGRNFLKQKVARQAKIL